MSKKPLLKTIMTPFPYSIELDASFEEASELMGTHNVHHLPVTQGGSVVGIITDRDMTSAMNLGVGKGGSADLGVRDLYIPDPYIISIDEPLENVLLNMARQHIGSAIVTRAGKLAGVFTAMDACRVFGEYLAEHFPAPGNDAA